MFEFSGAANRGKYPTWHSLSTEQGDTLMKPSLLLVQFFCSWALCSLCSGAQGHRGQPALLQHCHRSPAAAQESHRADTDHVSPGVRSELPLFWAQRRFRVGKRKIKLSSPQLAPHWVSFSKMESTWLLFSCWNHLLPGTPAKEAVVLCRGQGGLWHLLQWQTGKTDQQQYSLPWE